MTDAGHAGESLAELLARLGLEAYVGALLREELDLELLCSMEPRVLADNMTEIGMRPAQIERLARALPSKEEATTRGRGRAQWEGDVLQLGELRALIHRLNPWWGGWGGQT